MAHEGRAKVQNRPTSRKRRGGLVPLRGAPGNPVCVAINALPIAALGRSLVDSATVAVEHTAQREVCE